MRKTVIISFLFLVTIIIGLLNWWTAPTMSDDLIYHFVFQEEWQQPLRRIQTFQDVMTSQLIHYNTINGRSVAHTLAQVFLIFVPEKVTALINTAMFLLLIWLVTLYTTNKKEFQAITAVVTFGLLFLVIKDFGTGFTWVLGAIVYLWTLVFTMLFLIMLKWLGDKKVNWKILPLAVVSFFAGWSHEAIALPLSFSFILFFFLHRKHIFQRANTYCMIAYMTGELMILCSPALWNRANIDGVTWMNRIFYGCINLLFGIRISWLLILSLVIILFRNKQHFKRIIKQQLYLLSAWLVAIGIVFVCGITAERVAICADFLALLLLVNVWQGPYLLKKQSGITITIALISTVVAIPAIQLNYLNYQNEHFHRLQLEQANHQPVKVRQLPADSNYFIKKITKRYVNPTIEFNFYNCYMAFDKDDLNNKAVAKWFDKDYVVFLPEDVIEHIQHNETAYTTIGSDNHKKLFIYRLNRKNNPVSKVIFKLADDNTFYQNILFPSDNEYELDPFNYKTLDIDQHHYLVMTIPPSNIRQRIKTIYIK